MKQITSSAVEALQNQHDFNLDNTRVGTINDWALTITKMFLHGNLIAEYTTQVFTKNDLFIYSAWWETNTTKERLNWILEYFNLGKIRQIKRQWYLIDGDFKEEFNWQKNFVI